MTNYHSFSAGDKVKFKTNPMYGTEHDYHYDDCQGKTFEVINHFEDRDDGISYKHYLNLKCITDPGMVVNNPVYDSELMGA
jgi:hypothetical protein